MFQRGPTVAFQACLIEGARDSVQLVEKRLELIFRDLREVVDEVERDQYLLS